MPSSSAFLQPPAKCAAGKIKGLYHHGLCFRSHNRRAYNAHVAVSVRYREADDGVSAVCKKSPNFILCVPITGQVALICTLRKLRDASGFRQLCGMAAKAYCINNLRQHIFNHLMFLTNGEISIELHNCLTNAFDPHHMNYERVFAQAKTISIGEMKLFYNAPGSNPVDLWLSFYISSIQNSWVMQT